MSIILTDTSNQDRVSESPRPSFHARVSGDPVIGTPIVTRGRSVRVYATGGASLSLKHLSTGRAVILKIDDLADDLLCVTRPLTVALECELDSDEVLATEMETGISMAAATAFEALQALKDEIVDTYNLYRRESRLGPEPTRRLRVLEDHIGEDGGRSASKA